MDTTLDVRSEVQLSPGSKFQTRLPNGDISTWTVISCDEDNYEDFPTFQHHVAVIEDRYFRYTPLTRNLDKTPSSISEIIRWMRSQDPVWVMQARDVMKK